MNMTMELVNIPVKMIRIKENVRKDYDLKELDRSVSDVGVIQPITVKRDGDEYFIISGHRRFRSALNAGEKSLKCIVNNGITESEIRYYQLIENVQRKDLTLDELIDSFEAIKKMDVGINNREIGEFIGKSGEWVSRKYKAYSVKTELLEKGIDSSLVEKMPDAMLLNLKMIDDDGKRVQIAKLLKEDSFKKNMEVINRHREVKKKNEGIGRYGGFFITVRNKSCLLSFDKDEVKEEVIGILQKIRDLNFRKEYAKDIDNELRNFMDDLDEYIGKIYQEGKITLSVRNDFLAMITALLKIHKIYYSFRKW